MESQILFTKLSQILTNTFVSLLAKKEAKKEMQTVNGKIPGSVMEA